MRPKSIVPNSTVEVIYSTKPGKMTGPRASCKVSLPSQQWDDHDLFQKRMQIVLSYNRQSDEDSGWHVGGWMKESLGKALEDHPVFAGRLRRSEDGDLELVTNDSGVRCVEAQMPLNLVDFLQSKEKNEVEAQLVCWNDVDETNPQFSPLSYVQVTNFQCGGYSVGITCSLLLADPILMANFFNKWADIHRRIAYESEVPKKPRFHTPSMGQGCSAPAMILNHTSSKTSETAMFKVYTDEKVNPGDDCFMYFVLLCIKEAESKFPSKMSSSFTLITREANGDTKTETLSKQGISQAPKRITYELNHLSWEDLRTNGMAFRSATVPLDVSHWVPCNALEGMVLVVISAPIEGKFSLTFYVTISDEALDRKDPELPGPILNYP